MKKLLPFILLLLISCDIQKEAVKEKTDIDYSEWSKKETYRKGDTVSFIVPKYKDTTIFVTNREGTTIRTIYDVQGQVSNIDCYASTIKELSEMNARLIDKSKTKTIEKTEGIGLQLIPYIFALIVVLIIALFLYLKKR